MQNYNSLVETILREGERVDDRTGVGTLSIQGSHLSWDLQKHFPAIQSKKLAWRPVMGELLWFLEGSSNIERLREITYGKTKMPQKRTIWDDNYEKQGKSLGHTGGDLGPIYGHQWRDWNSEGLDQLQQVINSIWGMKAQGADTSSRRLVVSAWNPSQLNQMTLPPCHVLFRFSVVNGRLNLEFYQRSVDTFLGLPFNIASYATLCHIVAEITDLEVGKLNFFGGDTHLYLNHRDQALEMLARTYRKNNTQLKINKPITCLADLSTMSVEDFELQNYNPHPTIKAPMAK